MSASLYAVADPSTGEVVKEYPTATDQQMKPPSPRPARRTVNGREGRRSPTAPS